MPAKGRTYSGKFQLVMALGMTMCLMVSGIAIWLATLAPISQMQRAQAESQAKSVGAAVNYELDKTLDTLGFLAHQPVVIAAAIGEAENEHILDQLFKDFALLPNLLSLQIQDFTAETIYTRWFQPTNLTDDVLRNPHFLDAVNRVLDSGAPEHAAVTVPDGTFVMTATPILLNNLPEGVLVGISRVDPVLAALRTGSVADLRISSPERISESDIFASPLENSTLILAPIWKQEIWTKQRFDILKSAMAALGVALIVVFGALSVLGNKILVGPFEELRRSRKALSESERKQQELADVARRALDGLVVSDPQGRVTWVNPAFERLTGYRLEEVAGKKPGEMLQGPDTDSETVAEIRDAIENQRIFEGDILNYTKDGRPYWVHLALSPAFSDNGELGSFIAVERDVTKAKQHAHDLAEAVKRANAANKAKSQFLANMSHEIRTPMNGILGITQAVLDTPLKPEQADMMRVIESSGIALVEIINDILDLSKIEADNLELFPEPLVLEDLLYEVSGLVKKSRDKSGVRIYVDVALEVPHIVCLDRKRLRQVLFNLVGNAYKFTETGRVQTNVSMVTNDLGGSDLRIVVSDSGVGIPSDQLSEVFNAFQQIDNDLTRKYEGTGLGLAITLRLVKLMGGSIEAQSTPGIGSKFEIRIPLSQKNGGSGPEGLSEALRGETFYVSGTDTFFNRLIVRRLMRFGADAFAIDAVTDLDEVRDAGVPLGNLIWAGAADALPGEYREAFNSKVLVLYHQRDAAKNSDLIVLDPFTSNLSLVSSLGYQPKGVVEHEDLKRAQVAKINLSECKILVAEDNRTNRLVIKKLLAADCDLQICNNGLEAVQAIQSGTLYDCILMDISMPEMNGIDATFAIRAHQDQLGLDFTPIIALTANATKDDEETYIKAGMQGFVPKPIRKANLISTIQRVLEDNAQELARSA